MQRRKEDARRAWGTALIAIGMLACIGVATCMAMLTLLKGTAVGAMRDPTAISEAVDRPMASEAAMSSESRKEGNGAEVSWEYWKSINPHIVAWLHIPGTPIDYPIVQASENAPQFYLSHDVYGNWNPCGCLYIDAGCTKGLDSPNVIIYGHNMGDDTMFGKLVGYREKGWAQEHRHAEIITPDGTRNLTVVGASTVAGDEEIKRVAFTDSDDFRSYLQERLSACRVRLETPRASDDRMYTLCTCSYYDTPADERTLVYALEETEGTEAS